MSAGHFAGDIGKKGLIPGGEDPLEKEMTTHSSFLAWKIPRTEEPGGLHSPWGCKKSAGLSAHTHIFCMAARKSYSIPELLAPHLQIGS